MDELIKRLVKKYKTNNPFELAGALGIHIRFINLGEGTKGLYYRKLRRRFIVIHNELPLEWQRFVCAHELAHDRLHKGVNRFFLEENSFFSPGKLERQANIFAVKLLSAGTSIEQDESLQSYYARIGIPAEVVFFLDD
ncbi:MULTISPECIES: ImmA/IrrE family metallo-endopeptidase [Paenibacillus]|uniref:ImmA/IrrE family metallo-endopeptidase n=1 Tax=Paenibacillus TaxID=44249 RepID=UPI0004F5E21A|nr:MULTISPECIES: ImmA/IrrE family metallo-endopeptidase [unclassified Paenibacillus]AIQ32536.1 zinc peptidase [Paenibacillus sp. FSL P4-0081]KHL96812.1 zinc peptidase [Paenibacillus sp. IHB B 3415]OMF23405.1 ImmA/IrrE family metallo-endopeptidase [Paenibacillus sp. FSL H8-0259]